MKYQLFGSLRSPFARILRLFMIVQDIPFDFQVLNYLMVKDDAEKLAKENPINKIPFLVDGETKIFDSRVILNYLIKKHDLRPLTIEEENLVSAVYAALDSTVNLFLLKRDGFDLENPTWYLQRQQERIRSTNEFLAPWVRSLKPSDPKAWGIPAMSYFSYLYFASAIGMLKLTEVPAGAEFLERFKNAKGVVETDFQRT